LEEGKEAGLDRPTIPTMDANVAALRDVAKKLEEFLPPL